MIIMTTLLSYFFLFFIANPFGLVVLILGVVYAEYVTLQSIVSDKNHRRLVGYITQPVHGIARSLKVKYNTYVRMIAPVSLSLSKLKAIRIPIKGIRHKTRKPNLGNI